MSQLVQKALEREARLLNVKARILRRRIKEFEEHYGMSSAIFHEKFESGELGDEEDFFMWWSLLEALRAVEKRLKGIEKELQKLH